MLLSICWMSKPVFADTLAISDLYSHIWVTVCVSHPPQPNTAALKVKLEGDRTARGLTLNCFSNIKLRRDSLWLHMLKVFQEKKKYTDSLLLDLYLGRVIYFSHGPSPHPFFDLVWCLSGPRRPRGSNPNSLCSAGVECSGFLHQRSQIKYLLLFDTLKH